MYNADGTYKEAIKTNSGDDTVPMWSASNTLQNSTLYKVYGVEINHMGLANHQTVIDLLKYIIGDGSTSSSSYTLAASDLPTGVITDFSVNENGWLNATDNRRVKIIVNDAASVRIVNADGTELVRTGDSLYDIAGNYLGSIWKVGGCQTEFLLKYSEYEIEISNNNSNISIAYMDDGNYIVDESYGCCDATNIYISLPGSAEYSATVLISNTENRDDAQMIFPTSNAG